MTTNHHTPISTGAAANAATINSPLAELDAAIPTNIAVLSPAQTFTAAQKIDVSSITALHVEDNGVKDDVWVVDTVNGRIGAGVGAPIVTLDVEVSDTGAIPTDASLFDPSSLVHTANINDAAVYAGIGVATRTTGSARALFGLEWKSTYNGDLFFRLRNGASSSTEVLRMTSGGNLGLGASAPGSPLEMNLPTEDFEIVDAGSAGATEQDWIEVQIGGVQGYLRVYATK